MRAKTGKAEANRSERNDLFHKYASPPDQANRSRSARRSLASTAAVSIAGERLRIDLVDRSNAGAARLARLSAAALVENAVKLAWSPTTRRRPDIDVVTKRMRIAARGDRSPQHLPADGAIQQWRGAAIALRQRLRLLHDDAGANYGPRCAIASTGCIGAPPALNARKVPLGVKKVCGRQQAAVYAYRLQDCTTNR